MYSYDKNFSIYNSRNKNHSYGNLNQSYRNQSPPGTLVSDNFFQNVPTAIIYKKESRICPKKGNNFYYKGVS